LRSFCHECGKLKLKDDDLKKYSNSERAKKAKDRKKCPHCNAEQEKVKLYSPTTFYKEKKRIFPNQIREFLLKISDELGFKKGLTIVLGLGETINDYPAAKKIIQDLKIDRITYYALRPVRGTPYKNGPEPEDVVEWIANTRIDFPKIEIMAGTAVTRIPEINYFLQAGANGFTKLPATKIFGSKLSEDIAHQVKLANRDLKSDFSNLDSSNWNELVKNLSLSDVDKQELKSKLDDYNKMMSSH
jgi:hypothetical protein